MECLASDRIPVDLVFCRSARSADLAARYGPHLPFGIFLVDFVIGLAVGVIDSSFLVNLVVGTVERVLDTEGVAVSTTSRELRFICGWLTIDIVSGPSFSVVITKSGLELVETTEPSVISAESCEGQLVACGRLIIDLVSYRVACSASSTTRCGPQLPRARGGNMVNLVVNCGEETSNASTVRDDASAVRDDASTACDEAFAA